MHKLYKFGGNKNLNIIDYTGNISLVSSKDTISEELTFTIAHSDKNIQTNFISVGDIVLLTNGEKEIFRGIINEETINGRLSKTYRCNDFGWYLNKNEDIFQFNCNTSTAIERIIKSADIEIESIVTIPTLIKRIKRGKLSDIIKDFLDFAAIEQEKKYNWGVREGKFFVEEIIGVVSTFYTDIFGNEQNINEFIQNPTRTLSIDELKNSIKVVGQENKKVNIFAEEKDQASINKYGQLQKIQFLAKKDIPKARNIARNLLKELNKVHETLSITLPGNDDCKSNKIIKIIEPITGANGEFLITNVIHNITSTGYTMDLELEGI